MKDGILILIQLMGGLGLFLYGMKLMGDGLENAAGERLKSILERVTTNPISAVLVGTTVTAIIQSSSATTVMVVGFVNAGLMNLAQAAGVIIGANIGTTITGQLVAFKLDAIAPIFVGIGTVIVLFAKNKKKRDLGSIVLGFGILFMGMGIMSESMKPIADSPMFKDLIVSIGGNWAIGLITGLAMTAVLQSSSATTGILIALATTGSMDIKIAIPILFGCNIGTCVTALLATIGTNKNAHKAAAIHLIFNTIGVVIFIPFIGILSQAVKYISPGDVTRQIANAHTIFNLINAIIMLPLIKYLIIIVNKLIKGEDEIETQGPKYIDDRLLETPIIAADLMKKETIRMADKANENLNLSIKAFLNNDENLVKVIYNNEKIINILEEEITSYLVKLSKCDLPEKEDKVVAATFHILNDIERIGDHVENIGDLTLQKINKRATYTEEALTEINTIVNYTKAALQASIEGYSNRDVNKANIVYNLEEKIDVAQREYRDNHIKRLQRGECKAYDSAIFLELLNNLERIGDHSTNIADMVTDNY